MDSILTTLALTIFITFPGIVFRRVYFQHEFSKQFFSSEWNASLTFSAFFGIISMMLTLSFISKFTYFDYYFQNIRIIKDCILEGQFYEVIKLNYFSTIALFLILSVVIAVCLGHFLYKLVRVMKLDKSITFLRFENHWYYYFQGEALEFSSFRILRENSYATDSTIADVLVEAPDGKPIKYRGQLQQHTISKKTGDLELIYLIYAAEYDDKGSLKLIPKSDIFMIPYKKIININLSYHQEPNVIKDSFYSKTRKFLWLFYTFNLLALIFNLFKTEFPTSLLFFVVCHLMTYLFYKISSSFYEYWCLKKEGKINADVSKINAATQYITEFFAYVILFLIVMSLYLLAHKLLK